MTAASTTILATIETMLAVRADGRYGLHDVTQREHALQAAMLAERDGCAASLVTAALLHDVGHAWLAAHFGPAVAEPVRLHVAAKRYLVATEPDYAARLSPDSVLSLSLQGGAMSAAEVAAFDALAHAASAIRLRRYDDQAKVAGLRTPPVGHFMPLVASCVHSASG
jgi:predicted HD phosphohydrolase